MKRTVSILLLAIAATVACAADLRTLFVDMPDSVIPTLTRSERLDFLDYMDSGMKAVVKNRLGGESEMTSLSDRMLSIKTSRSGRVDIVLFKRNNGTDLVCLIRTVVTRFEDSRLEFYNEDWTPVNGRDLIALPRLDDYLTAEALRQDSLQELKRQSTLRLQAAAAVDNGIEFRYTSLDYIGEDADRFRSWFRSDPIRYVWTGKRFKRQ